ncbi:MAG: UrcA family protein [Parvularculaceae bacterium]
MKLTILSAATVLAVLAAPALAAPAPTHTVEVRLSAADLSSNPQRAYNKLVKAARAECITPGFKPLTLKVSENRCYKELIAELVEKVGSADVAALHAAPQKR